MNKHQWKANRESMLLSIAELAEKPGFCGKRHLRRIESGKAEITPPLIRALETLRIEQNFNALFERYGITYKIT